MDPWINPAELLTIGQLNKFLSDYLAADDDTKKAMDFNNCVHENLLQPPFSDSTLILDCLNIPELHIHLGVTTKLLTYIVKCFGSTEDDKAKGRQFYDQFYVQMQGSYTVQRKWRYKDTIKAKF